MTSGRWRVEHAAPVLETGYFRVLRADVRRPDATLANYHTIDFLRPSVVIALRDGGRTLLVRQQRFIVARDVWALPSGGVDDGEEPIAAAARELAEETGYGARRLAHALSYYPSYGATNQVFHCYVAEEPYPTRAHDPNEVEAVAWFDDAAVRAMIRDGTIPDGFSLTPLLYLFAGLAPQAATEEARCRRVPLDTPTDDEGAA